MRLVRFESACRGGSCLCKRKEMNMEADPVGRNLKGKKKVQINCCWKRRTTTTKNADGARIEVIDVMLN